MKKKVLSQEGLKLIACITMLIDHFGHAIVQDLPVPYVQNLYYMCRIIGRIAFPLYCFLLVEGMRHTRSPKKYIFRLVIGILLAEVPFDLLFNGRFTWTSQNVMVTLTLGSVMLLCMQKVEKKQLKVLLIPPFALLAYLAKSDYGGWGIVMIAVFTLFNRLPNQILGIFLVNLLMNSAFIPFFGIILPVQLYALLAMLPIALYSTQKRTYNKTLQIAFYLYYPVHLLILWLITIII